MAILREPYRFCGALKEETFDNGRYTLRYQAIDDKKHPDEVKPQGYSYPHLFDVFDGDERIYRNIFCISNDRERSDILKMMRREIERGEYASKKRKQ